MGIISDDVRKCDSARIDRMAKQVSQVFAKHSAEVVETYAVMACVAAGTLKGEGALVHTQVAEFFVEVVGASMLVNEGKAAEAQRKPPGRSGFGGDADRPRLPAGPG